MPKFTRNAVEGKAAPDDSVTINYAVIGLPMTSKEAAPAAREYLEARGWTRKAIKRANLRYVDGATVARLFPVTTRGTHYLNGKGELITTHDAETGKCHWSLWAIALPWPDDSSYGVIRVEYHVADHGKDGKPPPKFLNPAGRGLLPYFPSTVSRKKLDDAGEPLLIAEGPMMAAVVAASHGLTVIGVIGHHGVFQSETKRTELRPEIAPFMLKGRRVCLVTDADLKTNLEVRRSQIAFLDVAANDYGCVPFFLQLPDLGTGKTGIDDYFAAGHSRKDFDKLPRFERDAREVSRLRCALFDLTETGLAKRFEAQHGADVRFDPYCSTWFTYSTTGYKAGGIEPHSRMLETVAALADEIAAAKSTDEKKPRVRFANECAKLRVQNAALILAGRSPSMHIDAAKFDADSDLLGVQNGVVRLSTGELLAPSRDLLVTKRAAFAFDAKARAPVWAAFIHKAMGGDRGLIRHAQEIAGASFVGRADRCEANVIMGPSGTGKTVYLETLLYLHGEYGIACRAALVMKARHSADAEAPSPFLESTRGKRLLACSEIDSNDVISEAMLKDLTGGDKITARGLHKAPVEFRNTARILLRTNHFPNFVGTDESVRSRIEVLPFDVVIPADKRDKDLRAKLEAEAAGIFNWCLVGLRRYAERGYRFEQPAVVVDRFAELWKRADTLGTFIDDCLELDPASPKAAPFKELQAEVTARYMAYAEENGYQPMSAKTLWQRLRDRIGADPVYRGDGGEKYARGFKLRRSRVETTLLENQEQVIRAQRDEIETLKGEPVGEGHYLN